MTDVCRQQCDWATQNSVTFKNSCVISDETTPLRRSRKWHFALCAALFGCSQFYSASAQEMQQQRRRRWLQKRWLRDSYYSNGLISRAVSCVQSVASFGAGTCGFKAIYFSASFKSCVNLCFGDRLRIAKPSLLQRQRKWTPPTTLG